MHKAVLALAVLFTTSTVQAICLTPATTQVTTTITRAKAPVFDHRNTAQPLPGCILLTKDFSGYTAETTTCALASGSTVTLKVQQSCCTDSPDDLACRVIFKTGMGIAIPNSGKQLFAQ